MNSKKGFTLIELMVVIVIIGILSALALPKMFGVSAKAKAAEAPGVIANWEALQSAYAQENASAGTFVAIGFKDPSSTSKWFKYSEAPPSATGGVILATVNVPFGSCNVSETFESDFTVTGDLTVHKSSGTCATTYAPNF